MSKLYQSKHGKQQGVTHLVAPNALRLVSSRIAEKVFVITATKRFNNQTLRTMAPTMKKRHETKNSASIIWYMTVDQPFTPARTTICKTDAMMLSKLSKPPVGFSPVS